MKWFGRSPDWRVFIVIDADGEVQYEAAMNSRGSVEGGGLVGWIKGAAVAWGAASWALAVLNAQDAEVVTHRATYLPGEPIVVRFSASPGNLLDWVGLYKQGAAPGNFLVWQYLDGSITGQAQRKSGEVVFPKGIVPPGEYEVRTYLNDQYALSAQNTFTVEASPRLLPASGSVVPGVPIALVFTNGPGHPKDWIGIFAAGGGDGAPLSRVFLDGTASGGTGRKSGGVTLPAVPSSGSYEARWFSGETSERLDVLGWSAGFPAPVVAVSGGRGFVLLQWPAVVWPGSEGVDHYEVHGAPVGQDPAGVLLGTVAAGAGARSYRHEGLAEGAEFSYVVSAMGAGGVSRSSVRVRGAAAAATEGTTIAHLVPHGTRGSQDWEGALGMDFELVNAIRIVRLGVFDDGSDGLSRPLTARIFDRTTRQALASVTFSPAAPGVLIGGSRFKSVTPPLELPSGFKGVVVAEGYGPDERAGNSALDTVVWRTDDGIGSVLFTGKGRTGRAGAFPSLVDKGAAARYAAGTFEFVVTEVRAPGKPVVQAVPDDGKVTLSWPAVTAPKPAALYRIYRGAGEGASLVQIGETAGTEYVDEGRPNGQMFCYRVRAVTAEGVVGPESDAECQVPDKPEAGVAYSVAAETAGNQAFGGSMGNDFDVVRPVRVVRIGAFDDGSDGLNRAITVRVYDRVSHAVVASMAFTPGSPGTLEGGFRFKPLEPAVVLPLGFEGAVIASGYGAEERDGNLGINSGLEIQTFTGGCLRWVGSARWGDDPDGFPEILDGGPAHRYAAGTFAFEPAPLVGSRLVRFRRVAEGVVLEWDGGGVLESATSLAGPWAEAGVGNGQSIVPAGVARYYRLR